MGGNVAGDISGALSAGAESDSGSAGVSGEGGGGGEGGTLPNH